MKSIITLKKKIVKFFEEKGFGFLTSVPQKRMQEMILSSGMKGNTGKTSGYAEHGSVSRTAYGHFLSKGKWDERQVSSIQKRETLSVVLNKSKKTGKPLYIKTDDTVCEKKPPSSKAKNPTEGTGWHYSHLENGFVFGHQVFTSMVSCGEYDLCHSMSRYEKGGRTKIEMTLDIISELPQAEQKSYALLDSWYTSTKIINGFTSKNYDVIGAIKSNRVIYPDNRKVSISDYAASLTRGKFHSVTVKNVEYLVFRYVGRLNGIEKAVILLTYPKAQFGVKSAFRAFICTDTDLSDNEILEHYAHRWSIETFFQLQKKYFGLNKFMIRSVKAIDSFLIILAVAHFFFTTALGKLLSFADSIHFLRDNWLKQFKFAL
jgi:hypothetical protein